MAQNEERRTNTHTPKIIVFEDEDAGLELQEKGFFGRWANEAGALDSNLTLYGEEADELIDALFDELFLGTGRLDADKKRCLRCVLANLYDSAKFYSPVMVSFDKSYYSLGDQRRYLHEWFSFRNVKGVVDALLSHEYIRLYKGFQGMGDEKGRATRIDATDQLKERFEALPPTCFSELPPKELVQLKEGDDLIDYDETEETTRMRTQLQRYNAFLQGQSFVIHVDDELFSEARNSKKNVAFLYSRIRHNPRLYYGITKNRQPITEVVTHLHELLSPTPISWNIRIDPPYFYRVFNHSSWAQGGRFYGTDIQGIPKPSRRHLMINGEPTAEPDFGGMHLRMLYHLRGIDIGNEDLYASLGNKPRAVYKAAALIVINCEEGKDPVKAISRALSKKKELYLQNPTIATHDYARELIAEFRAGHPRISEDFFSGKGIELQYLDSQIMSNILRRLQEQNIVGIPIHDSVIVPQRHEETAKTLMREEYRRVIGFDPVVD